MTPEERGKLLDEVDGEVDRIFAADIKSLCACTRDELQAIAPADLDPETFQTLMAIVSDATLSNDRKAARINAVAGLSTLAIGLAAKLAKA